MGATDLFAAEPACPPVRIARTGHLSGRRLRRALDYIQAHLTDDLRLEDIAAAANLSASHFARKFKLTTGLTPHRYLMKTRVERVKELLLQHHKTLTEIASEAGFSDQSHMSNVFRRFTGSTPREFRDVWKSTLTIPPPNSNAVVLAAKKSVLRESR
jgi:AraC family transcriptional regulator